MRTRRTTTPPWMLRLQEWAAPFHRFVRAYTAGMNTRDLQRLFQRDAADAYKVLIRDQSDEPEAGDQLKLALHRVKIVFLGLSYKLTPVRRLLFTVAIGCLILGVLRFDFRPVGDTIHLDDSPLWFVTSVALLLFLLVLELVDRIRYRDELEIARQLQRDLLPQRSPQIDGYCFAFSYRTANTIGGDYYDFLPLPDGRLAVVAGDASGHGVGAGLLMAITNAALRLAIDMDSRPEHVASLVNSLLFHTGGRRAFMTLFYGVLEPANGHLDFVCMGHPFPLLRRASGEIEELGGGGLPLGLRPSVEIVAATASLEPGDLLLLYSDGLPEAFHRASGRDYGFDRVRLMLADAGSAVEIHDRIIADLRGFLGGEPLTDDVSLVLVQRGLPATPEAGSPTLKS